MGHDNLPSDGGATASLVVSSREFFEQMVSEAFERRKVKTHPHVKGYLVGLLELYIPTENLFDDVDASGRRVRETLAETMLKAQNADALVRIELLKKLADRSLYISGFFGDSLQRKLVDVDYYADMGCMAYGALASSVREDLSARVYREFSKRFLEFVDILSDISSQAKTSDEQNIMRLYEVYARTGSTAARERLIEKGLIAVPVDPEVAKKKQ
jgi:hypothetical protein